MNKDSTLPVELPLEYRILPESIDFVIPGFKRFYTPGDKTLALRKRDCALWFHEFVDRLVAACGREYLPVCRMSDGEFKFVLGKQLPDKRLPIKTQVKGFIANMLKGCSSFEAVTIGHYHSGRYSQAEWKQAKAQYATTVAALARKGILALHLSYGKVPFQEHYFPALGCWLEENQIRLTDRNYFPFYFVYAALTGPRRGELLNGRRVLVVNGASGEKRDKIVQGLLREGVASVAWHPISLDRSLYDRLDTSPYMGMMDIAVIGAGIGKPNVLMQLESLKVPCIDAGYVFEVWANPENRWKRAFCVSDGVESSQ